AVAAQDFEKAVRLRDQADKVKRERQNLIRAARQAQDGQPKEPAAPEGDNRAAWRRLVAERLQEARGRRRRLDELEKRVQSLEGRLGSARFLLGALAGVLAGTPLAGDTGAILGFLVGGLLAALGRFVPAAIAGGVAGAFLGGTYLADAAGTITGTVLGAVVAACIVEVGRPSGQKRFPW